MNMIGSLGLWNKSKWIVCLFNGVEDDLGMSHLPSCSGDVISSSCVSLFQFIDQPWSFSLFLSSGLMLSPLKFVQWIVSGGMEHM